MGNTPGLPREPLRHSGMAVEQLEAAHMGVNARMMVRSIIVTEMTTGYMDHAVDRGKRM